MCGLRRACSRESCCRARGAEPCLSPVCLRPAVLPRRLEPRFQKPYRRSRKIKKVPAVVLPSSMRDDRAKGPAFRAVAFLNALVWGRRESWALLAGSLYYPRELLGGVPGCHDATAVGWRLDGFSPHTCRFPKHWSCGGAGAALVADRVPAVSARGQGPCRPWLAPAVRASGRTQGRRGHWCMAAWVTCCVWGF